MFVLNIDLQHNTYIG